MKPQAEFRKVLIVWGVLVGLAIVGMAVGKMMWKRRAADRERAAKAVSARALVAAHGKLMACLQDGERDLANGVVAQTLREPYADFCRDELDHLPRQIRETTEKLGVEIRVGPTPQVGRLHEASQLEMLCEWVETVTNQIAIAVGPTVVTSPACSPGGVPLELVRQDDSQLGSTISHLFAGDELHVQYRRVLYRRGELYRYTLARTKDGTEWMTQAMPEGWFSVYEWTDRGFVAVVTERPADDDSPYLVHTLVDGMWQRRARLRVPRVDLVKQLSDRELVVVAGHRGTGHHQLLRSRDGGKTFARPLDLGGKPSVPTEKVSLLADGSTLVMSAPGEDRGRFDAHTFDPLGKGPTRVAALTWEEPVTTERESLAICRAGTAHWAVVHGHVMYSETGTAWREVQDLLADLPVHELDCTADRFAFATDGDDAHVRSCERTTCSGPLPIKRSDEGIVALRIAGANLEVWRGPQFSASQLRRGERVVLAVHRVAGSKLVLDRLHVVESSQRLPVVRDERGFFALIER